jgi:hypothetical protein
VRRAAVVLLLAQLVVAAAHAGQDAVLDRVALAVDGAESSHGADPAMWRPDPSGPQGPMQVSEAAASDVGGGDRFDMAQNRSLGRAYLAQLYRRYGNWPDAIAAYKWGVGNMDAWVGAGRPPDQLLAGVAAYVARVLSESGLCEAAETTGAGRKRAGAPPREPTRQPDLRAACAGLPAGGHGLPAAGWSRFRHKLDLAMQLVRSGPSARRP